MKFPTPFPLSSNLVGGMPNIGDMLFWLKNILSDKITYDDFKETYDAVLTDMPCGEFDGLVNSSKVVVEDKADFYDGSQNGSVTIFIDDANLDADEMAVLEAGLLNNYGFGVRAVEGRLNFKLYNSLLDDTTQEVDVIYGSPPTTNLIQWIQPQIPVLNEVSGYYELVDSVNTYNKKVVNNNCALFDGTAYLTFKDLTGVTIVSNDGTANPTISGDTIIGFGAGETCWNLLLSNGSLLKFSEGEGVIAYDSVNDYDAIVTTPTADFWGKSATARPNNLLDGFGYNSYITGKIPQKDYVEKISYTDVLARHAPTYPTYAGSTITVGSAGDHATITAAIAASSSGDIIEILENLDLSSESGGYLLFNTTGKNLKIIGTNNNITITHNGAGSYGIRIRRIGELTFEDLKIVSDCQRTIYVDAGSQVSGCKIFFDNVEIYNNYIGSGYCYNHVGDTNAIETYFNNCLLEQQNAGFCFYSNASVDGNINYFENTVVRRTDGTATISVFITDLSGNTTYIYDCNFYQNGSNIILKIGEDTAEPTNVNVVDVRGSKFIYTNGTESHAVLFGRGSRITACINNDVYCPPSDNVANIGIAIKSINIVKSKIYGNNVIAGRPIVIKGGKNNDIQYNTFVCNAIGNYAYGLELYNAYEADAVALNSQDNDIKNNYIYGKRSALYFRDVTDTEDIADTLATCDFDNNTYYSDSYYIYHNTGILFANRTSFWAQDANSVWVEPTKVSIYDAMWQLLTNTAGKWHNGSESKYLDYYVAALSNSDLTMKLKFGDTKIEGYTLVNGTEYVIKQRITIDFTANGSADNNRGTIFTADATADTLGVGDIVTIIDADVTPLEIGHDEMDYNDYALNEFGISFCCAKDNEKRHHLQYSVAQTGATLALIEAFIGKP